MAGGEGSRLRPLTSNQPKPMLPLVNRPMMEHIVGLLKRPGFDGIFVLEPEIFDYIPAGEAVDFSNEVFPKLLANSRPLYGAVADGYWEDVGTLEAYVRAHKDVLDHKVALDIPGFRLEHGVWLGEGAEIHPDARVEGPAVIGEDCRVGAGARLGEYTVLG